MRKLKSNIQGFKEATFIQMGGRRGRDTVWCQELWGHWWRWNGWFHIHMWWMKIGRDTLGASDPSPRPDHTAHGSNAGKIKPHNFWLYKPVRFGVMEETAGFLQVKGPAWT